MLQAIKADGTWAITSGHNRPDYQRIINALPWEQWDCLRSEMVAVQFHHLESGRISARHPRYGELCVMGYCDDFRAQFELAKRLGYVV